MAENPSTKSARDVHDLTFKSIGQLARELVHRILTDRCTPKTRTTAKPKAANDG